ncbi:MAG: diguanylate cyclase [Burkholderiales bacterium]|nr:diguanylate cyclase [Burkholderiales bacterium]
MESPKGPTPTTPRDDAEQLRLIADNVPAMSIAYDKHLHCLFANRRFAEFFGFTTASIVGKHLREVIGEGPYQEVKCHFDQVLAGTRATYRRTRTLGSGELRHLEVELIPHIGPDGHTQGLFAVTTDVTERERTLAQLRDSEARFRCLTDMSSDFYWESDAEHRISMLNAGGGAKGMPALRRSPQIGERRWEIAYLSPDEAGWQAHRAVLDAHLPFRDFRFSRPGVDGRERHLSISGDPVFDSTGAFEGYRGVGSDITASKLAEQALRESEQELRLFADNVPAMTVSYDQHLRCRFVNKAYLAFFGFAADSIVGMHVREVIGDEAYREVEGHFGTVMRGRAVTYQRTHTLAHGEPRHLEIKLLPRVTDSGSVLGCFAVATDVTQYKLAEERIRRVAHHDGLTGLPNRLLFNDRLNQAISLAKREARQLALLYLDLDKFKPVNDTLGHAAGDELLQAVAARLRQQVRESDTVARIGGDEFAVILPGVSRRDEARRVADKALAALATPFRLIGQGQTIDIGASIGVAIYPDDGASADALVKAADNAMYSAKHAGGGIRFLEH